MSHHKLQSGYSRLKRRLNYFPQGVGSGASDLLFKIMSILFTEKEAELLAQLPLNPFRAKKISQIWKMDLVKAQKMLNKFAGRGILFDIETDGESVYALAPPMTGFFEFTMMRLHRDIDYKKLSELLNEYLRKEEDFIKDLLLNGETKLGRVLINEHVLSDENASHVLDYESAEEVIKSASHLGVGLCYCRHKMLHVGKACDAPQEMCLTLNRTAETLTKHGINRKLEVPEALALLQTAREKNLVQFADNVREDVNFICNCCSCCCEFMVAAKKYGTEHSIHTTNFIVQVDEEKCKGCGKCVAVCPVEALTLIPGENSSEKKIKFNSEICLGCGVCVRNCSFNCITLIPRREKIITPLNTAHKFVIMAIERGTLQHTIINNQSTWSHRTLAAILGVILKLPPFKQAMASKQLKSRYLEALIRRKDLWKPKL